MHTTALRITAVLSTTDSLYRQEFDGTPLLEDAADEDVLLLIQRGFVFELSAADVAMCDPTPEADTPAGIALLQLHAQAVGCGVRVTFDATQARAWFAQHPERLTAAIRAALAEGA